MREEHTIQEITDKSISKPHEQKKEISKSMGAPILKHYLRKVKKQKLKKFKIEGHQL